MWPFNRRKKADKNNVPPEVKKYYESEHRERVGLAWLIAFLSLVATVLVVLGLFFGGRWTYRQIAGNDNEAQNVATQNGSSKQTANKPVSAPGSKSSDTDEDKSTSSSSKQVSTPGSDTASSSESNKGGSSKNLSETGPGENLAIFIGTAIAGTLLHQVYLRRRNQTGNS